MGRASCTILVLKTVEGISFLDLGNTTGSSVLGIISESLRHFHVFTHDNCSKRTRIRLLVYVILVVLIAIYTLTLVGQRFRVSPTCRQVCLNECS